MKQPSPLPRIDESRYAGRWVAIDPFTRDIVADGLTLKDAKERAIRLGITDPLMHPVPKSDGYFIGTA